MFERRILLIAWCLGPGMMTCLRPVRAAEIQPGESPPRPAQRSLFVDDPRPAANAPVASIRGRRVNVDSDVLTDLMFLRSTEATLTLFGNDRVSLENVRVRAEGNGGVVIAGGIADVPGATAVFVVDRRGLVGNIRIPGRGVFHISPQPDGTHTLWQIDTGAFPSCGTSVEAGRVARPPMQARETQVCDDGKTLDLLVVYTQTVKDTYFNLDSQIDLMIAEANQAYFNSAITTRLRLAHAALIDYDESGNSTEHLNWLEDPGDGIMDEVHLLRNEHQADVVSLLVRNGAGICGRARIMLDLSPAFESQAFHFAQSGCAFFNLTFAHELGHNLGNMHNIESTTSVGVFDYSRGFRLAGAQYGTIMATMVTGSTRILQVSNPDLQFMNLPTGVALDLPNPTHTALTIDQVALTVANFRQTADCNDNGVEDSVDIATGTSNDVDGNGRPDECEPDCDNNGAADSCDILDGTHSDCNTNFIPDTCDIDNGANDCTANGILDVCEPDCNGNDTADSCDIDAGTSFDCDGASNGNGIPDECEADCNSNTVADSCEIARGTSADTNGNGIPDECRVRIYVDSDAGGTNDGSSWGNAYVDLQDALTDAVALAGPAFEVILWVAEGIYTPVGPNGDREATFTLVDNTEMYGGFGGGEIDRDQRDTRLNRTVLSGDLNGDDVGDPTDASRSENSYRILTTRNVSSGTRIDGFIIVGGNANGPSSPNSSNNGGGLIIENAETTVVDCTFVGNRATTGGGAILSWMNSNPRVESCRFFDNRASEGGAITHNFGACGVYVNCVFSGNVAINGGAMRVGGVSGSTPELINCTIVNNPGGGLRIYPDGTPILRNSIVWGNVRDGMADEGAQLIDGLPSLDYCCVQGWTGLLGGEGNHGLDPQFINALGADGIAGTEDDDAEIALASPCVDAGNNQLVPPDLSDLDRDGDRGERIPLDMNGRPRFGNVPSTPDTGLADPPDYPRVIDMGALEIAPTCGDASCDLDEDMCNCPFDCGVTPSNEIVGATCSDGLDNDCDLLVDCLDDDCLAASHCCLNDSECDDQDRCTLNRCVAQTCANTPHASGDVNQDGVVDVFDLFCVLNGFEGVFADCTFEDIDIEPCGGNDTINVFDLFAVLNGFSGEDPCCSN